MGKKKLVSVVVLVVCVGVASVVWFRSSEEKPKYDLSNFKEEPLTGLGVNAHYTSISSDVGLMDDSGLKIVRMELNWATIEHQKGIYDFKSHGYDKIVNSLVEHGIRPYFVLDYSNSHYEKNQAIVTEKGRKAFDRFVNEVTKRYKDKGAIWEIWNEPNSGKYWYDQPSYADYSLLVKSVTGTIKQNDPEGIIVAPALSALNDESLKWTEEIFKRGVLSHIDAVSVHPYRGDPPETVSSDYEALRELIKRYTDKDIPIVSGEWGYSTGQGQRDDNQQASNLTRMFLMNMYEGIPISIWYDWRNDGTDPNNIEHNFGLRENDVTVPKHAYFAVKTLTKTLDGYKFYKRIDTKKSDDYILTFRDKKNNEILVCWTKRESHIISLPHKLTGNIISIYGDNIGNLNEKNPKITLTNNPIYIRKK